MKNWTVALTQVRAKIHWLHRSCPPPLLFFFCSVPPLFRVMRNRSPRLDEICGSFGGRERGGRLSSDCPLPTYLPTYRPPPQLRKPPPHAQFCLWHFNAAACCKVATSVTDG